MAPAPASPSSDGDSDSNGGHDATWGITGLVIALAFVSVVLRFYTRIFTRAGLQADDWLILAALAASLAVGVLVVLGNVADPDGLRMSENTDPGYAYTPQDRYYLTLSFACSVLYFTIAGATKLGILLMYHRIFAVSTGFRRQLFAACALVAGWWFGCTVAALRKCQPLAVAFTGTLNPPEYCFDFNIFWLASGICEIFLDAWILSLPVSVVARMRYSVKQKLAISGIFLLGAVSIITGIVKIILSYKPEKRSLSYANTEVWTALHTGIAILCASLPILRPLLNRITGSSFVTKISSLLSRRRRPSKNESASKNGQSGGDSNSDPQRPLSISFIASEFVQNILKQPNSVQRTYPRPELPPIETLDAIELLPQTSPSNSTDRSGSRDTGHRPVDPMVEDYHNI
ncbi:hypothetical protein M426DRAFT_321996 [Hypoxylon sp. CI-4A]|nr:hypothetical protein M426DRAFT_321996 [Hypoxylon sp. CI-4A]